MLEKPGFFVPILTSLFAFVFVLWKILILYFSPRDGTEIPGPGKNRLEAIFLPLRFFYREKSLFKWIRGGTLLYGREGIFQFKILTKEYTVISSPELAETVLNNTVHIEKPAEYQFVEDIIGSSVGICNAKDWKIRRKMLNPAFHKQVVDGYIPIFNEKARDLVTVLQASESTEIDFDPIITHSTIYTIAETAFGLNWQEATSSTESKTMIKAVHKISKLFNERLLTPWQWIEPLYYFSPQARSWKKWSARGKDTASRFIAFRKKEFTKERIEEAQNGSEEKSSCFKKRVSFLDLLLMLHLQEGSMDLDSVLDEVITFFFAGHDTLTLSLSWTLFLLGHHPDVQKKAQLEIEQVMGLKQDVEQEDLKQLQYLECVFKESLRLFPPGPNIARKLTEPAKLGKYTVPSGKTIMVNIHNINRDPREYKDPDLFDPDRFLPENSAGRSPFSFVTFSGGPRGCIGQNFAKHEAKIFLTWILREFKVESRMGLDNVHFTDEVLLRSRDGMPLVFKKRNT